jgi:hypothetical protein
MSRTLPAGPVGPEDRPGCLPNHIHVVYRHGVSASLAVLPAPAPHESRAARACVRPACTRRATTTLRFDYAQRTVTLDPLGPDTVPGEYDLCLSHAARSTPPTGWTLRDRAPSPEAVTEPAPPVGPDRGQGVARLAAALSAVPRAVSEDAPDAAPVGTDRSVDTPSSSTSTVPRGAARLDGLLRPTAPTPAPVAAPAPAPEAATPVPTRMPAQPAARVRPVPLSERTPEVEVRPVPQPLRLVPDPTTTVWCADLLAAPQVREEPVLAPPRVDDEVPTLPL